MHILNQNGWRRRATFEHFRSFSQPFFNVCTEIDVTALKAFVDQHHGASLFLAYHYLSLRALNGIEEFRHRLHGDDVVVHAVVHGSTTVLRSDDTFAFADLVLQDSFDAFSAQAARAIAQARDPHGAFTPTKNATDVVHYSTLPWIRFTGLSHPHNGAENSAIPKVSFGKLSLDAGRAMLPMSVEVHHALVDGVHVGRMVEQLAMFAAQPDQQELCARPAP